MPPVQKSDVFLLYDELIDYYKPIHGGLYLTSLITIPPTIEYLQRKIASKPFKTFAHMPIKGFFGKLGISMIAAGSVTVINHACFSSKNLYNSDNFLPVFVMTFLQFSIFYRKKLLPSDYFHVGAFARTKKCKVTNIEPRQPLKHWNSAVSEKKKEWIQLAGRRFGCHTCGTRFNKNKLHHKFIADHQPPISLVAYLGKSKGDQSTSYAYPHCKNCSQKQAGISSGFAKNFDKLDEKITLENVYGGTKTYAMKSFYFILPWCFIVNFVLSSKVIKKLIQ